MIDPRLHPLYYLHNFKGALHWLAESYADLLSHEEQTFIDEFEGLPSNAQALLVRLFMRKHTDFRASKVRYPEIGDIRSAAAALLESGLLDDKPLLTLSEAMALLRREEINQLWRLDSAMRSLTKTALIAALQPRYLHARTFESWRGVEDECVYRVLAADLCTRLRLLFFGSFHQDWSEFVLADLGIFRYEDIALSRHSRAFQSRADIELFVRLYRCRRQLEHHAPLESVLADAPDQICATAWIEDRRSKLLFEIAHRFERAGDVHRALEIYARSRYPGARLRRIRVLERAGLYAEAIDAAREAAVAPESGAELQGLERIIRRLCRGAGVDVNLSPAQSIPREDVLIEPTADRVEECVRQHLSSPEAPIFYVENALISSLFGLLFWEAIFAPIPGAFFHRFHAAPMDLYEPHFVPRRQAILDACFARLDTGEYREHIRRTFAQKFGVSSPFVAWGLVDAELLELALHCIAPEHLRLFFTRILDDLREHCTGLPDLIQFWPQEQRYALIEVKGPGDRLQDHQQRWAQYCCAQDLPLRIVYVQWTERMPEAHDHANAEAQA